RARSAGADHQAGGVSADAGIGRSAERAPLRGRPRRGQPDLAGAFGAGAALAVAARQRTALGRRDVSRQLRLHFRQHQGQRGRARDQVPLPALLPAGAQMTFGAKIVGLLVLLAVLPVLMSIVLVEQALTRGEREARGHGQDLADAVDRAAEAYRDLFDARKE